MKIYLIRHGKTLGNTQQRYVGSTDESILEEERERLSGLAIPPVEQLYASPRKRCLETAEVIYPGMEPIVVDDLAECDFGDFEYKNYIELSENEDYQKWIDSGGTIGFPGGEDRESFQNRCERGYRMVLSDAEKKGFQSIALFIHGGTIMALMERVAKPHGDYYSWHPNNGGGYLLDSKTGTFQKIE